MKKLLAASLAVVLNLVTLFAARQTEGVINGSVVDAAGAPLGFATVYLSAPDSTIVTGASADLDGAFTLKAVPGSYTLTAEMIGYRSATLPVELPAQGLNLPPIRLEEDSQLLEGALVQAVMPKTKLTGEGLQTSIRGSVLENAGSASDVLAKTPGMLKGSNGLEVIGKGSPLIYINGHRVTDSSELERLQSNEIQSIEVITNPGAQYDATVKSVVRIKTIKRQGDGFGFNINASDAQSLQWAKGNDPFAAVNANYRTGGLDFFAGVNYQKNTSRQISDANAISYYIKDSKVNELLNDGDIEATYFGSSIYGNAGVNWQLSDNHFLGGKLEWGKQLSHKTTTLVNSDVYENGVLTDRLSTLSTDTMGDGANGNIGGNLYYNGLIGEKLGVDVNLDYYGTDESLDSASEEDSSMTADAAICSGSTTSSRLWAAKAVLSYPIWMGQLQAGTEETFTNRSDEYHIQGIAIPSSSAEVDENIYAGFASYAFMLPKFGMFNAGVRYEYVHYAYEDALQPAENLTRDYGHWFPTFSYANAFGPVQLMLNYSTKTLRPNYSHLSSAIRYNSRYIWQSGNAQLQPQISQELSATAVWKWITFVVNYTRTDDTIMTWSQPYVADGVLDGVVLVRPRNIDTPFRNMTAFVNLTPTIGPWNLNYTIGLMPQWMTLDMDDPREATGKRTVSFSGKTPVFAQVLNTLTLKGGWQFELGGLFQSKGNTQNVYLTRNYIDITASVQKTLLKDGSLVLRLEGHDLANQARADVRTDFGSHYIIQTNQMDMQKIKFSIRYSFNTAQSKYRGTGAGSDEKARM